MRVVFLTPDDPIYLPAFFDRVLGRRTGEADRVYIVPPLYRDQSKRAAAWRYYRTFGFVASVALAQKILQAKLSRRSVSAVCELYGIPCEEVADVNAEEFLGQLVALRPDLIVSVSCPQIFKRDLIELPAKGCLNVHGALLPDYRGVMPSFWMLANGETQAGVSVHFVDERIDAGELCGQRIFRIEAEDTLDEFLRRSKRIAADLLVETLERVESGAVERRRIDLTEGSYYSWPDRQAVERFAAAGRRLW
jgi:methionyl-tRNA formyltransferase